MVALAPLDEISPANPLLSTFTAAASFLADPVALSYQIFRIDDDAAPAVQVFPATLGARQGIDLIADRLGVGRFAATWTVPADVVLGRHEIRWFATQQLGGPETRWRRAFDVLALSSDPTLEAYALVSDVRAESTPPNITNARILEALARGAEQIRDWTGHDFMPRYKVLPIDGIASQVLPLNEPICAIESIAFNGCEPLDSSSYDVYARHLLPAMFAADDRQNPRIEFCGYPGGLSARAAYRGYGARSESNAVFAQEMTIRGVFGYTERENDGCPVGITPRQIRRANVLIALRDLYKAGSAQAAGAANAGKIKVMRTREQTIEYDTGTSGDAASGLYTPFTGDPEIDRLLLTKCAGLSGTGI